MDKAKATGHTVADAASKAKTPLIAGGTALAGVAAGAVIKSRTGSNGKNPLKKLGGMKSPNIDLDTIKTWPIASPPTASRRATSPTPSRSAEKALALSSGRVQHQESPPLAGQGSLWFCAYFGCGTILM